MIQPGLERITRLLQGIHFPWKAVHVAGTNGKGSICGYTSNLLTRRSLRNGRFTSPHLVNRWDCININNKPVSEEDFLKVENHYKRKNELENIQASEFELLTATAFTLFNEKKVEVAVIEVGMGGKLDATNVLNNQVVSVISKIAEDHQGFLGNSIQEIASHKAGILRPNIPWIVAPSNRPEVIDVVKNHAKEIGAAPMLQDDTQLLCNAVYRTKYWKSFAKNLQEYQRENARLGFLAYLEVLKSLKLDVDLKKAAQMMDKMRNKQPMKGRLQHVAVPVVFGETQKKPTEILIDGAHNPDAARLLGRYVYQKKRASKKRGVTWVLAMTEGKDARGVLKHFLQSGDYVIATQFGPVDGMPWVRSMDPEDMVNVAKQVCPTIKALAVPKRGVYRALCAAKYFDKTRPIILAGSLYLVGDFFREHEVAQQCRKKGESFPSIQEIDLDERARVNEFFNEYEGLGRRSSEDYEEQSQSSEENIGSPESSNRSSFSEYAKPDSDELKKMRAEMAELEKEMQLLTSVDVPSAPKDALPNLEDPIPDPEDEEADLEPRGPEEKRTSGGDAAEQGQKNKGLRIRKHKSRDL